MQAPSAPQGGGRRSREGWGRGPGVQSPRPTAPEAVAGRCCRRDTCGSWGLRLVASARLRWGLQCQGRRGPGNGSVPGSALSDIHRDPVNLLSPHGSRSRDPACVTRPSAPRPPLGAAIAQGWAQRSASASPRRAVPLRVSSAAWEWPRLPSAAPTPAPEPSAPPARLGPGSGPVLLLRLPTLPPGCGGRSGGGGGPAGGAPLRSSPCPFSCSLSSVPALPGACELWAGSWELGASSPTFQAERLGGGCARPGGWGESSQGPGLLPPTCPVGGLDFLFWGCRVRVRAALQGKSPPVCTATSRLALRGGTQSLRHQPCTFVVIKSKQPCLCRWGN